MKDSKELKNIFNALDDYIKKNQGNVNIVGSIIAFDKEGNVKEDRLISFGYKKNILISLKEITENVLKEKGEFVNW